MMRGSAPEMAKSKRFPIDSVASIARSARFLAVGAAACSCRCVRPFCSDFS